MKKKIPPYFVINWDFNTDKLVFFDVMPYLVECWKEDKKKRHKLWAIWYNNKIEEEDWRIGMKKGLTYTEAKKANLSKKQKLDDTKMPETFDEFKFFVNEYCFNRFWGGCEYEVIVTGWPQKKNDYKLDVYEQIKANIDILTKHFKEYIKG